MGKTKGNKLLAVRVKVVLKPARAHGKVIETSALVNSGYESETPEIVIPETLAERLGFFPRLPAGTRIEEYRTVAGLTRVHYIPKALEISVVTEDRKTNPLLVNVAVASGENEILLSDKLIDRLSIVIEKAGEGLWRFADDKPAKLRKSVKVERH